MESTRGIDSGRRCSKCQTQQAAGKAEQQAFEDGFADDDTGSRAQGQADGEFATLADGPDQQKTSHIDAGNQQNNGHGEEQSVQRRTNVSDGILKQRPDLTAHVDRRHTDGKIAHNLLGDTVGILRSLREGDAVLNAGDHLVAPDACVLIGEFIRGEAHGHPELRLIKVPGLQRKLEIARHDTDNRVCPAVEVQGSAEDAGIAVIAVQPQGVTDDGKRQMGILFLRGEDTSEDGLNAQCGKDAGGEAGGFDLLWNGSARELVAGGRVSAQGGKSSGCARVGSDLTGSDGSVHATSQLISQQNQLVGMLEWKGTQQDAFDDREDRGGGADTQGQGEDDGQGKAG